MTNSGICRTYSGEKISDTIVVKNDTTITKKDTTLLVENGLIMIKDTAGVTYIALDYDNLNYVITLIEEGNYNKDKVKQLKKISNSWKKSSQKKDEIIEEKNKTITEYAEIRLEQDTIIIQLKENIKDLEENYADCQTQRENDAKIIENKDAEIESNKNKIKRKNKTIVGLIFGYIIIGATIIISVI